MDYDALETIHHLLQLKADLAAQLSRCPRAIKAAEAVSTKFERAVEEAKTNWQNCKKDADAKQMTLKQREARIEQLKTRRNACDSNKEFQLLNDQIAADVQANSVQADEILELLDKADTLNSQVAAAREEFSKAQKDFQRVQAEMDEKRKKLEGEIAHVNGRIAAEEKKLSGEFLNEYRRRIEHDGENALGKSDGETCGNCHQVLTTQTLSELRQQKPVFCKGCGAILYMPKANAVRAED